MTNLCILDEPLSGASRTGGLRVKSAYDTNARVTEWFRFLPPISRGAAYRITLMRSAAGGLGEPSSPGPGVSDAVTPLAAARRWKNA